MTDNELDIFISNIIHKYSDVDLKRINDRLTAFLQSKAPKFVKVEIGSYSGNISCLIEKETGFECYHRYPIQTYQGCGTNYVLIPEEKYTKELHSELLKKYDSFEK